MANKDEADEVSVQAPELTKKKVPAALRRETSKTPAETPIKIASPSVEIPETPLSSSDRVGNDHLEANRNSILSSESNQVDEGMPPRYDDGTTWLRSGLRRHPRVVAVGLVFGWTGLWLAFWGAMGGAILGVLIGTGLSGKTMPFFSSFGAGQSVTLVSAVVGFFVGAVGGFIAVVFFIVSHPLPLIGSLVAGALISFVAVTTSASCERISLRLRGYRRLSRDEARRVAPLVKDAAEAMSLPALPRFAMADQLIPNAWTHMRTVVVTTGLLQTLDDGELRAVLVHEFKHWKQGDTVGLRCVWAASLPVVLIYNLGCLISGWSPQKRLQASGSSQGIVRWLVAWLVAWPSWVMTKVILTPMLSASQRRREFEADAAACKLGFGPELSSALRKIGAFETGRTGWEAAMSATHPPVELRLEALQQPRPDDWEYQEEELHGPTLREFFRMFGLGIRQ